jgi:hypothetical protein
MQKNKDYTYFQDLMSARASCCSHAGHSVRPKNLTSKMSSRKAPPELRDLEDMQSPHNVAFRLGQLWAKRLLQDAVVGSALLSGKLKCPSAFRRNFCLRIAPRKSVKPSWPGWKVRFAAAPDTPQGVEYSQRGVSPLGSCVHSRGPPPPDPSSNLLSFRKLLKTKKQPRADLGPDRPF